MPVKAYGQWESVFCLQSQAAWRPGQIVCGEQQLVLHCFYHSLAAVCTFIDGLADSSQSAVPVR